jgi:hypothetical protein
VELASPHRDNFSRIGKGWITRDFPGFQGVRARKLPTRLQEEPIKTGQTGAQEDSDKEDGERSQRPHYLGFILRHEGNGGLAFGLEPQVGTAGTFDEGCIAL